MKFEFQGLQVTPKGVWVHFTFRGGTVVRHAEVLIPWAELVSEQFLRQLDRQVARVMMEKWSGVATDPLF